MMKSVKFVLVFVLMLSLLLVGCTQGPSGGTSTGGDDKKPVSLTFTSYVIADGGTYFYLKPVEVKKTFSDEPSLQDKVKFALSLLASKTIATSTTMVPLPEGTKVLSVQISGSTATVNFSEEIMKNPGVGAEGEMLALCSIPMTLKQFGIEKVYVLINGQKPSEANGYIDFWGHVGLYNQPLTAKGCDRIP